MGDIESFRMCDKIHLLQGPCRQQKEHATWQISMPKAGFEPITPVCLRSNNTLALTNIDTREIPGPEEKHFLVCLVENVLIIMHL